MIIAISLQLVQLVHVVSVVNMQVTVTYGQPA